MTVNSEDLSNHHPSFLTLIARHDMKFALSPTVWMTFEIDDTCILWCDLWMKHLWWHFHIALFIFQREIWKCCWLIFLILVTIETNPVIKFKYFKTGNSGPWKHLKLFDLKRNYIMDMLWFNFILDLYIFNNNCFKLLTMPLSFITIPPKNKRKIIKCKPWTTTFTFFTTLIFNVTLSLFSDSHPWILE